jgi:hypothetical protein
MRRSMQQLLKQLPTWRSSVNKFWLHRTNVGRIVYETTKHPFTWRSIYRICKTNPDPMRTTNFVGEMLALWGTYATVLKSLAKLGPQTLFDLTMSSMFTDKNETDLKNFSEQIIGFVNSMISIVRSHLELSVKRAILEAGPGRAAVVLNRYDRMINEWLSILRTMGQRLKNL